MSRTSRAISRPVLLPGAVHRSLDGARRFHEAGDKEVLRKVHEMSLLSDVVDIVNAAAEEAGVSKVSAVQMTIGDGRDIVFDIVDSLFEYLSRGTRCEGAKLEIDHVPLTVRCRQCGTIFPINVFKEETWTCPGCGAHHDYELNGGMEFRIDGITVANEGSSPVDSSGVEEADKLETIIA